VIPDDLRPASFEEEQSADLRHQYIRQGIRLLFAFVVLFAAVFAAFRWSGAAVRFGASRVADRAAATWRVSGTVRNVNTHDPIPWAAVEDDASSGQPPYFHADANQFGEFELLTLPEPHRIRVSASGYHPMTLRIGRVWFLWLPRGVERHDIELSPE